MTSPWQPDDPPTIIIECRKCGKEDVILREDTDPVTAIRVQILCPDCNQGDFDEPLYFDIDGKQVFPAGYEDAQSNYQHAVMSALRD